MPRLNFSIAPPVCPVNGRCAVAEPTWRWSGGFIVADMVVALILLAVVTAALTAVASGHRRGALKMAEMRAAIRATEAALLDLQAGRSLRSDIKPPVQVIPLSARSDVPGRIWVEVRDAVGNRSVSLTGLIPASAPPTERQSVPQTAPSTAAPMREAE